jgi:threonine/homoserine/homoserine lactone efflux protein
MLDIFVISFLVALTGALTPGPVLTFTIYKSLKGNKGYLAGLFIILGHALLEFTLILVLLLGLTVFFQNILFLIIIGIIGGILLMIYGILAIREVYNKEIDVEFSIADEEIKGFKGNSFLGGILLSLSNPYWTFWWAVTGVSLMINLNISFENPAGLIIFFIGHEAGDLIWYVPISIFIYLGGKNLNPSIYKKVLIISALFMIGFGSYLTIKTIMIPPQV